MAGEIFKKKREESGFDIKEISELLKIKADYLNSIENDLFEKLPVEVYTKGYIRCYAKYLGIDPEPVMQYYSEHLSHPKASTILPVAASRKRTSKIFYLIPAAVVITAAFFISLQMSINTTFSKPQVITVPAAKETEVEPAVNNYSVLNNHSAVTEAAPVVPEKKVHALYIAAHENTWMSIKSTDGRSEEVSLRSGETKKLDFSEKVYLRIGNAGGIRINLDGKDMGLPGDKGQVVNLTLPSE